MKFKIIADKDYKIESKKLKLKNKKVIPTVKVEVTDPETGVVEEDCDMNITREQWEDVTPYVKLFRPNLIEQLSRPELRLFCYIMERMNQFNVVEIDMNSPEMYEYTGFKMRDEVYRAIGMLKDMSVILHKLSNCKFTWKVSEDCMEKRDGRGRKDKDNRPFVKIYEPRVLLGLSDLALSVFSYICVRMDFEGCIRMRYEDFRDLTGYKKMRLGGKEKYNRTMSQFYTGKKELKEKDIIRDITTMVAESDGKALGSGKWFRVNPNVFIRGCRNRVVEGGYGVE